MPSSRSYHAQKTVSRFDRRFIPPYPYGQSTQYKQRDSGLYGNAQIQYGNNVSERNEIKTRRVWRLNMHRKRLWSNALQDYVRVKVQARVLRTIDKVGGLDEYLLGEKTARIKELGVEGWALRWKIMNTKAVRNRRGDDRERLGIPRKGWEDYLEKETEKMKQEASEAALRYAEVEDILQVEAREQARAVRRHQATMRWLEKTRNRRIQQAKQRMKADAALGVDETSPAALLTADLDAAVIIINEDLEAADLNLGLLSNSDGMVHEPQDSEFKDVISTSPPKKSIPNSDDVMEESQHSEPEVITSPPPPSPHEQEHLALYTELSILASRLKTTLPTLLDQGRETLTARKVKATSPKVRKQSRRQYLREQNTYEPHPEIENAIATGAAQELMEKYHDQYRSEKERRRRERNAEGVHEGESADQEGGEDEAGECGGVDDCAVEAVARGG
ncbi:MAG: hypothetical protein Q9164_004427 [Protoblastenia rupestris]